MHVLLFINQVLFSDETYVDVGEARSQFVRRGVSDREASSLAYTEL